MGKQFAKLGTICVVGALAFAPAAIAKYPVPPTKGGTGVTKVPAKKTGKQVQGKTGAELAKHGITIKVTLPKKGTLMCVVKDPSGRVIASGAVSGKGRKTMHIKFTAAGKKFVKSHAGATLKIVCTFTPVKGKKSTSTSTATLG